ncbi:PREDICTED: ankyrin repeat and EF-hand domain-containing protein 1-like [Branchiostoma belcheri]|uniref:Ankyrin repeat and EF-hand domain-containing protein 1-like n=1 Tax=Branchiostoma belcheri TaxID=7741 RepID=A0A6P4ZZP0_BRABE|nr:PREDICTED: ankyrin repeat and EF-hand domain-containing protein 1-like [Branchiostoma belcheri]
MAKPANEALMEAVNNGCLRGVKAALKAGADVDYAQRRPDNDLTGSCSSTALFHACIDGHTDIVRLLIRKGASVSKRVEATIQASPLHGAASRGHTEVVELLVRHGATLDMQDGMQATPIMAACMYKRVDTVRRLIELGARVDLTTIFGNTAQWFCEFDFVNQNCDFSRKELVGLVQEALQTKLLRCCNPSCGKPGYRSNLKLCAQCKLTRYCSRDCQKQHWTVGHKKSCGHDTCIVDGPVIEALLAPLFKLAGKLE